MADPRDMIVPSSLNTPLRTASPKSPQTSLPAFNYFAAKPKHLPIRPSAPVKTPSGNPSEEPPRNTTTNGTDAELAYQDKPRDGLLARPQRSDGEVTAIPSSPQLRARSQLSRTQTAPPGGSATLSLLLVDDNVPY